MERVSRLWLVATYAAACAGIAVCAVVSISGDEQTSPAHGGHLAKRVEAGPVRRVVDQLLQQRLPTEDVLARNPDVRAEQLEQVVDALRAEILHREDNWVEAPPRSSWGRKRHADRASLLGSRAIAVEVTLLQLPADLLARVLPRVPRKAVPAIESLHQTREEFFRSVGLATGPGCQPSGLLLRRGEVARLAYGWERSFLASTVKAEGDVEETAEDWYEGVRLVASAYSEEGQLGQWSLQIEAEVAVMREPVIEAHPDGSIFTMCERDGIVLPPTRIEVSATRSCHLVRLLPPGRDEIQILVCGRVVGVPPPAQPAAAVPMPPVEDASCR